MLIKVRKNASDWPEVWGWLPGGVDGVHCDAAGAAAGPARQPAATHRQLRIANIFGSVEEWLQYTSC